MGTRAKKPKRRYRNICFWCHMSVPTRADGSLFKHKYAGRVCSGSGKGIFSNTVRYWEQREATERMNDLMRRRTV